MSECEHDWWDDDDRCEKFCPKCGVYHVAELQAELTALREAVRIHLNLKDCSDIDQVQRSMDVIEKLMESNK